jgi:hypothetical protein
MLAGGVWKDPCAVWLAQNGIGVDVLAEQFQSSEGCELARCHRRGEISRASRVERAKLQICRPIVHGLPFVDRDGAL